VTAVPVLLPVAPLLAALLAGTAELFRPRLGRYLGVIGAGVAFGLACVGLAGVITDGEITHQLGGWPPPIGIEYILDPLSAFVAVLVTFITLVVLVYPTTAGYYTEPTRMVPLHAMSLLLLTGLLGVIVSGDLFHLFVFLEVYAIATYALVTLGGDRAVFASFRYLILGTIGSGFYLLGVGFVYFSTGSLNMADVAARLPAIADSPSVAGGLVLIVVGLGLKMALFPLHVWLPDAHSYAPPSVAALLAAVQVKVGAYALIRILLDVFGLDYVTEQVPVMTALAWFGAAGVVVGSVWAIRQTDLKRLLAYSTVAQLGYIGIGIGLATPLALIGALLHVLNHGFMKCCLFLVAGGVIDRTGLKSIPRFAGLGPRMPYTMAGFTVAALSMVGIPPTAGFFSKWYLVLGSLEGRSWVLAGLIVASSLLTLVYFLRIFERVYMAPDDDVDAEAAGASEASLSVVAPILVLAVGLIVLGVGNVVIVEGVLEGVADGMLG
jgi:multicomponent Na+:H+ antiporter subunit D